MKQTEECLEEFARDAFRRAHALEKVGDMRSFVAQHGLVVDTKGDGRRRGVKAAIKARILVALHRQLVVPSHGQRQADPKQVDPLALVLDMDECLIHSMFEGEDLIDHPATSSASGLVQTFTIRCEDGSSCVVNLRPGLEPFLLEVCSNSGVEVHIFTAGTRAYAAPLLDELQSRFGVELPHRHYRDSCTERNGHYMKDLKVLGRADLSRIVLVDNSLTSFVLQPLNGVKVSSFINDPLDSELAGVANLVRVLQITPDVRPVLAKRFELAKKKTERCATKSSRAPRAYM